MRVDVLWLAALALTLPAVSQCDPLFVLIGPNVLRLGTMEKVFVEAQEYRGIPLQVEIMVKDFGAKPRQLWSKQVTLSESNDFQAVEKILIPETYFDKDKKSKHYVYLQAKFPSHVLEKVVLVSFQSGHLFVQTDKPIYIPEDTVLYRVFAVNPDMAPTSKGISVGIMNPDGITVEENLLYPSGGVISSIYKLPEIVREGTWKVLCGFGKSPQNHFTAEFEVKKHVMPSFEIKLTPQKSFFHLDDTELIVDITAKYLYGKDVSGKAFVVFGVLNEDGQKQTILASLQRADIRSGKGTAKLTNQQIQSTFINIRDLEKQSLYVSVSILTSTGSEMVSAERRGIQIVTSPYTIHFKKTPIYFKPGIPFEFRVYISNPDNTPAKGITVEETKSRVLARTKENGVAKLTINTHPGMSNLPINVVTKVSKLKASEQAMKHMVAQPYKTHKGSKNYLHISLQSNEIKVGGDLDFRLLLANDRHDQDKIKHLTYLVMSRGKLILANRYKRETGQSMLSIFEPVTKDMVPSIRIVAYYHVGLEVVSDSIWVDVKDTCMGTLTVTTDEETMYEPRMSFSLTITGDPGAKVGIGAVDKGVYVLNNANRLTQTKIWDVVEKHDIGCTTGSGANSMAVFFDAGLVFVSNAIETTARAVSEYGGAERKCCKDGMVDNLMGYTCERRAQFIMDSEECVKAFVHCCLEVQNKTQEARTEEDLLERSGQDEGYINAFSDITSRTQFDVSWLWNELQLPPCPTDDQECESTSIEIESYLQDSITTWVVTAISVSETHGVCVADPFEMQVMKTFFIDLKLPYAAVRNEQVELRAVLYNYDNKDITVRVHLLETEHVCSAASRKQIQVIAEVKVEKWSSRVVPFVIIPFAIGQPSIEVKAHVIGSDLKDGIRKKLRVVAEGQRIELTVATVLLNPAEYDGVQTQTIPPAKLRSMVPDSDEQTHIIVTGQLLSQTIDAAISGINMDHLIQQPTGCGEQNMMRITGPVIATLYLDRSGQWDKVGLDRRAEALRHITTGYNTQLHYRQHDGSFRIYAQEPYVSSTWLTAYVAKIFGLAYYLIPIKEDVLCRALKWLVLNTQEPDGVFREVGTVYQSELMGGVNDKDPKVALTAFVLIAMQESSQICLEHVPSLRNSMTLASKFLSANIKKLTNTYAVALTSYALAMEGKHHLDILNQYSYSGSHWDVPNNHYFTLEATGYALMALVKAKKFDQAGRVVKWLTEERFYGGFYGSTQATVIVFQALALYMTELPEENLTDLSVTMSVSGRQDLIKWKYDSDTMHVTRSEKIKINKNMTFTAKGTGQGTLSVMTIYNALPEESKKDCENFELEVKLEKQMKASSPEALETYILTIEMMYKSSRSKSTMSILDVTMLSGFVADPTDLQKLTAGKDQYAKKIEMNTQLSEKGSLIFYLDKVPHQLPNRYSFRIHKMTNVGLLQPAAVTLYEYNSMEKRCMKFYHPEKKDGTLNKICHKDVCRCAEENCSYQKKQGDEDLDRATTACLDEIDYVYKVKVIEVDLSPAIDRFTVLVDQTIKEGSDYEVQGKKRTFLAHPYCREAMSLIREKTYLIMGLGSSLSIEDDRMIYMLGGGTWIEYWPTETECKESSYQQTCQSLSEDAVDVRTNGCIS